MDSPETASGTPRMEEKGKTKGQVLPIAPCPPCGSPVVQERVGGSVRRFCSASCRWAWHRGERRRKLIESVEDATCSTCRKAVLEAIGLVRNGNSGDAP